VCKELREITAHSERFSQCPCDYMRADNRHEKISFLGKASLFVQVAERSFDHLGMQDSFKCSASQIYFLCSLVECVMLRAQIFTNNEDGMAMP
jgi:hypothetical protein